MPIYEFQCDTCQQRLSLFQRSMKAEVRAVCPGCGGNNLRRLISRFAVVRSADAAFDDSDLAGLDTDDPQAMERWARSMGEEMGSDFDDEDGGFGGDDDFEP